MPIRRKRYPGLAAITSERIYQVEKGWSQSHDKEVHGDFQLASAAQALLKDHVPTDPAHEKEEWIKKIRRKHGEDYEACLRIAGALIAAELTRIGAE